MENNKLLAQGLGELIGTGILASTIYGAIVAGAGLGVVALVAGVTLALLVLVIGPLTGSHVNPAVTISLWTLGKIKSAQAVTYLVAQFLGAFGTLLLFQYLMSDPTNGLATSSFDWRVFTGEAVGTAVFLFAIAAAVTQNYKNGVLAATVGGGLFLGILVAAFASDAILNPALAVSFQAFNWTYALAPLVGGIVGANLFARVLAPELDSASKGKRK